MTNEKGVLTDRDYHPPTTHFVSKGCERCPDYMKRDARRTIRNSRTGRDETNPNYGDCYRPICPNGGILNRGDASKRASDYDQQGECTQPPCKEYERRQ